MGTENSTEKNSKTRDNVVSAPPASKFSAKMPFAARAGSIFAGTKKKCSRFYGDIWTPPEVSRHSLPMHIFSRIWRVVEITISNTISNDITIHAAALTYYALMALAPVVMLALTIFGIVMNVKGEEAVELVQERMAEAMQIILPDGEPGAEVDNDANLGSVAGALAGTDFGNNAEYAAPETQVGGGQEGFVATTNPEPPPATDPATTNPEQSSTTNPESGAATNPNLTTNPDSDDALKMVAPQLQEFSGMLLKNTMANSGSTGTIGTIILAVLAIFMIAHIEDAYNRIWAVKKARSWAWRFFVYFIFIVVGGVLTVMATSILSVSAIFKTISESASGVSEFAANVPGGVAVFNFMTSFIPVLLAFAIFTVLAGCANRYLPNARVRWIPALIGGAFVSIAFIACVKAASLFVGKISEFNSIYGNLGVIFILMFGLYLSWLFLLIGGQVAYAVQNEHFLKNPRVKWQEMSTKSRQEAYFACLFSIFRACADSRKGMTLDELATELRISANMVSECISTLSELNLILERVPEAGDSGAKRYSAELPVGKMTISEIRAKFDNFCPNETGVSDHNPNNANRGLELGGNATVRAALAEFSATFDLGKNNKTLESLLR